MTRAQQEMGNPNDVRKSCANDHTFCMYSHLCDLCTQARVALQKQARDADIVIMSYETLRSDVAWVSAQPWLYAVLDEGHTVRNSKSQIAQVRPSGWCHLVQAGLRVNHFSASPAYAPQAQMWHCRHARR
jgi:SNF2-related domain